MKILCRRFARACRNYHLEVSFTDDYCPDGSPWRLEACADGGRAWLVIGGELTERFRAAGRIQLQVLGVTVVIQDPEVWP